MEDQHRLSMSSARHTLKLELLDGSIQEIEYVVPIDHYEIVRLIYHNLKYDQIYQWNHFYHSISFIRTDNGIETSSPLNYPADGTVYTLVLPGQESSKCSVYSPLLTTLVRLRSSGSVQTLALVILNAGIHR